MSHAAESSSAVRWSSRLACYLGAMILEPAAVYFSPAMATWDAAARRRYERFSTLEETLEVVGTTLLLLTVVAYTRRRADQGQSLRSA